MTQAWCHSSKLPFSFYNSNSILKFTFTVLRTDIRLALKSTEDIENGGGSILHNVTCEVTKCDFMCDISNLFQILMHWITNPFCLCLFEGFFLTFTKDLFTIVSSLEISLEYVARHIFSLLVVAIVISALDNWDFAKLARSSRFWRQRERWADIHTRMMINAFESLCFEKKTIDVV